MILEANVKKKRAKHNIMKLNICVSVVARGYT